MATQGLFQLLGESPQEVRRKYEAGLMLTPEAMGQQNLLQQVASTIAQGGASAGYGLGRMLGAKAPGEAEAEAQQAALLEAQQSGLSGSALYKRLADISADPRRAFVLRQQAAEMEAAEAKAAQDAQDAALQRRKTLAETLKMEAELNPDALKNFSELEALDSENKYTKSQLMFAAQNPKTFDAVRNELVKRPAAEKPMDYGVEANRVAATFINPETNKPYTSFADVKDVKTRQQILNALNKAKENRTTIELTQGGSALEMTQRYDNLVKTERQTLQAAKQSITLLNEATQKGKAQGNVSAWNAARVALARAIGEGKLSNADIERLGGSAGLFLAVEDIISKAFTGVPSLETQAQLYRVAKILELAKTQEINALSDKARSIFKLDYPDKATDERLNVYFPKAPVPFGSLR